MSHLLIEATGVKHVRLLTDDRSIVALLDSITAVTGLKPLDRPKVYEFPPSDGYERGITAIVVFSESHASYHSYKEHKGFAFDLYSCRCFDVESAVGLIKSVFGEGNYVIRQIDRHIGQKSTSTGAV